MYSSEIYIRPFPPCNLLKRRLPANHLRNRQPRDGRCVGHSFVLAFAPSAAREMLIDHNDPTIKRVRTLAPATTPLVHVTDSCFARRGAGHCAFDPAVPAGRRVHDLLHDHAR